MFLLYNIIFLYVTSFFIFNKKIIIPIMSFKSYDLGYEFNLGLVIFLETFLYPFTFYI